MGVRTSDIDTAASGATPATHNSSHQDGGADEISVTGLSGVLADPQVADKIKTATTTVSVSAAAAPSSGQVLTATSSTVATWQTPSSSGGQTVSSTKNSNFTAVVNTFYPIDTTSGNITATLPTAASSTGQSITFKRIGGSNFLAIDGAGSELIDGGTLISNVPGPYGIVTVISNGTKWYTGAGHGDVVGAGGTFDHRVAAFSGTTGTILEDTGVLSTDLLTTATAFNGNVHGSYNSLTVVALRSATTDVSITSSTPAAGQALIAVDTTDATWQDVGDVDGPASATDNLVATFNGTTGKLLKSTTTPNIGTPTGTLTSCTGRVNANQTADKIATSGTAVTISSTAPTANQVLTATGSTAATWQTPSGVANSTNDFRLTGVTATPVMTSDSTSLSTIYLTPYTGSSIALYDGTSWALLSSAEVSLAVTGRTTDLPFDIFAYNSSGTVTLEFLNWTNATTRATALVRQDGVWCKTGALTRRYVGTCRPRSATTFHWVKAATDSPVKFDLWNASNRKTVNWTLITATDSWVYSTSTWRQCQGSTNYQVDLVAGIEEDVFSGSIIIATVGSTNSLQREIGFGIDSTTSPAFGLRSGAPINSTAGTVPLTAMLNVVPIGSHFYAWLEIAGSSGTMTWYGDNGTTRTQGGMTGTWVC